MNFSVTVTDYSNTRGGKSGVALKSQVGARGRVSFAGPLITNPFSLDGQLEATGLTLATLKPYVESRVNVVFTDGTLAAKGRMSDRRCPTTRRFARLEGRMSP